MRITAAWRALAPFSFIAGKPVFFTLGTARSAITHPATAHPSLTGFLAVFRTGSSSNTSPATSSRKAVAKRPAANDGQHTTQIHCFLQASSQAALRRNSAEQLSLLGDVTEPTHLAENAVKRPLERIRLPRKPAVRRSTAAKRSTGQPLDPSTCVPVQRCSAQAANDASIKMYWAKPQPLQRQRGMRWAMSGTMADIFAELERLERLERTHAAVC